MMHPIWGWLGKALSVATHTQAQIGAPVKKVDPFTYRTDSAIFRQGSRETIDFT